MGLRSLLALAVLLSTSLLARAADTFTVFDLSSTFVGENGPGSGSISGTLTLDDTLGYFTSADLTASGFPVSAYNTTLTSVTNSGDVFGAIGLQATGGGYTLDLYLMTSPLTGYTGSGICSQTSSPACYLNDSAVTCRRRRPVGKSSWHPQAHSNPPP